jgi:hypothetical protein
MAVGQQRAHAELGGEREGLLVGGFGWLDRWRIALRMDLTQEPEGPSLESPFFAVARELKRTDGKQ